MLAEHVSLEVECIDRMYLNLYVPMLQRPEGAAHFFLKHRGYRFASSALKFSAKQRKEDLAKECLEQFEAEEGVLFIGKAQEETATIRTQRRYNAETGAPYPNLYKTTAMVNQYYFYAVDRDFGPFFIKFSSYFPYNGKLLINGHEYAKKQLERRGIGYEALDNGVLRVTTRLHFSESAMG